MRRLRPRLRPDGEPLPACVHVFEKYQLQVLSQLCDLIAASQDRVDRKELEIRSWYYLGLHQLHMSRWLRFSILNYGTLVVPPVGQTVETKKMNRVFQTFMWGNEKTPGAVFAIDSRLPEAKIVDRLGTGEEPEAFFKGSKTGSAVVSDLWRRTAHGEFFTGEDRESLKFLPKARRKRIHTREESAPFNPLTATSATGGGGGLRLETTATPQSPGQNGSRPGEEVMAKNQAWCVYYRPHWIEYLWRSEFPSGHRP